jgi:hypothetical protein
MTHVRPTTLQATDWETFLDRISVAVPIIVTFLIVFFIV